MDQKSNLKESFSSSSSENLFNESFTLSHDDFLNNPKALICPLNPYSTFSYGVGHFLNDISAACLFNYLLVYLTLVNPISDDPSHFAGQFHSFSFIQATNIRIVLLSGQIADATITPAVGYLIDLFDSRFGKRKIWYFFGNIITSVCFVNTLSKCTFCRISDNYSNWVPQFNYIFFISVYNIGWAFVQVAHMSLPPALTNSRLNRDKLNNIRNTFTFIANVTCLGVALILFATIHNSQTDYTLMTWICAVIGLIFVGIFLIGLPEKKMTEACETLRKRINTMPLTSFIDDESTDHKLRTALRSIHLDYVEEKISNIESIQELTKKTGVSPLQWFSQIAFYQYGIVYMSVRISMNVGTSMLQFYLIYALKFEKDISANTPVVLAIIPMIIYISSSITSLFLTKLAERLGRKLIYFIGTGIYLVVAGLMIWLPADLKFLIYIITPFLGAAQSMTFNMGLNYIGEVVGSKSASGTFVYGAYGFADKLSNGLILYFIMNSQLFADTNILAIRLFAVGIPSLALIVGGFMIAFGKAQDFKALQSSYANIEEATLQSAENPDVKEVGEIEEIEKNNQTLQNKVKRKISLSLNLNSMLQ